MLTYEEAMDRIGQLEGELAATAAERDAARLEADQLRALAPHDATGGVPVAEFKRRLAGVYYVLGTKPEDVQRRWDRVLSLLDGFSVVYPAQDPVAGLLQSAVGDGLLTAEQAAALTS